MVELFSRIPNKRLRRFTLFNSDIQKHASHVAAALISTPATRQLRQVSISSTVLPMEADALLEGLSELQDLELKVKGQGKFVRKPWAPSPGQHLRRLKLTSESSETQRPLQLDIAGVASSKQLQRLHLHRVTVHNWQAIRSLEELQELLLNHFQLPDDFVQCLKELPALVTLLVPCWCATPEHWQHLAGMKQLQKLQATMLQLDVEGPERSKPSSSITCLELAELSYLPEPPEEAGSTAAAKGCLAQLLPALQHCQCELHTLHNTPAVAIWRQATAACAASG